MKVLNLSKFYCLKKQFSKSKKMLIVLKPWRGGMLVAKNKATLPLFLLVSLVEVSC